LINYPGNNLLLKTSPILTCMNLYTTVNTATRVCMWLFPPRSAYTWLCSSTPTYVHDHAFCDPCTPLKKTIFTSVWFFSRNPSFNFLLLVMYLPWIWDLASLQSTCSDTMLKFILLNIWLLIPNKSLIELKHGWVINSTCSGSINKEMKSNTHKHQYFWV